MPPVAGTWPHDTLVRRTVTLHDQRLMVNATRVDTPSGRYLVELGSSLQSIDGLQDRLLALLGLLLPVLVICAAGGGYLLVNWAMRPVDRMSQTAEHMSMQNLDARLTFRQFKAKLDRILPECLGHLVEKALNRESIVVHANSAHRGQPRPTHFDDVLGEQRRSARSTAR